MKAITRALIAVSTTVLSGVTIAVLSASNQSITLGVLLVTGLAASIQFCLLVNWSKTLDESESKTIALLKKTGANSKNDDLYGKGNLVQLLRDAEIAITEAFRKERSAVENAIDVICVIDTDGKILSANQAARSVWGYPQEALIGHLITDFLVASTQEESLNPFLGAEQSIEKIFVENKFRKKSGEIIDLLWSAHWSASDSGLFCVAHDITARKRAQMMLEESEKRIRLILECVPAGIVIINERGYFEFMNNTSLELTECLATDADQIKAGDLFPFAKDPFNLSNFIASASEETKILKKNGAHFPCDLSVRAFQWNESNAALVIFIDLSDKYAAEQGKREFITMVSHDLRSPLGSINSVLSLISEGHLGELSESGKRLAAKTTKESLRLIQLINDLLDIEKIKSGRFVSNLAETSVLQLAKDAIEVVEKAASMQNIKILLNGADCICICDGARIIQVLVNLLDNAIKYTQSGQEIQISLEDAPSGGCLLSVRNRGRSIPSQKLKTIFESFTQVSPSAAQERKGSGLGLAICKSIVEQHGEKIWVESSTEEGTKFTFSLGTSKLETPGNGLADKIGQVPELESQESIETAQA